MSGLQEWIAKENSKFEYRNSKHRMSETEESSKRYDLDERTLRFARDVRAFKYMKSAETSMGSPLPSGRERGRVRVCLWKPPSPARTRTPTLVLSPSPRGEAAERTEVCCALCWLDNAQRRSLQLSYSWKGSSSLLRVFAEPFILPSCSEVTKSNGTLSLIMTPVRSNAACYPIVYFCCSRACSLFRQRGRMKRAQRIWRLRRRRLTNSACCGVRRFLRACACRLS